MLQLIRRLAASDRGDTADEQLLTRFAENHDENAFGSLVLRHGPLVLHVCRQVLRDPQDVEDAFQATFLVLVRRAGSIRRPERLAGWLYGVAYRVATRVRLRLARLRSHEKSIHGLGETASVEPSASPDDWYALHEEVNRLPEKYRLPIVLCYF
ncbi:MAG TPA: sigma-70 family RNA polymerase sigma factor [Gemmataceae bacterium]|nr:sigma-70 family RNA polymerase sigma factor [Gemmataceae bacterium]